MISSSKKFNLLSRAPQRFLTRRLRKLTLSPTFKSKVNLSTLSFYTVIILFLIVSSGFFGIMPAFLKREELLDRTAPLLKELNRPFEALRSLTTKMEDFWALSAHIKDLHHIENEREFWKAQAAYLRRENEILKNEVHFKKQRSSLFGTLPDIKKTAQVIARPMDTFKHHFIIEGGGDEGIAKGDVAITAKGLVGRFIEVGKKASRLLLITDMDSRVPVILESSKHSAILMGEGTNLPLLTRLQEDMMKSPPQIGELVCTSGVGGIFPPNIPIGIIASKTEDAYRVQLFNDFNNLSVVTIVPSYEAFLEDLNFDKV
ncbi:MAG: rod shape-determining protein MreC [Proteobacteria bacterium]|nr:rod shape-determining protein MreC [Pseudomonadota bacterium]